MEKVNIIIKNDIYFADGFAYKAKSIYENVSKFEDNKSRICYEPKKGYIISRENIDNIIEVGFISSELYRLIKNLNPDPEELEEIIKKVSELENNVVLLTKENKKLTNQLEDLNKKCDVFSKIGTF